LTDREAIARSEADAPQIDGVVRISAARKSGRGEKTLAQLRAGDWADVTIVAADSYDLTGRLT
jgi:hypothetical protein